MRNTCFAFIHICLWICIIPSFTGCNLLFLTEQAAQEAIGDADGDGLTACSQSNPSNTCDCDDQDKSVHPNGNETCDGIDSDCSDGDGDRIADDETDIDEDEEFRCSTVGDCDDNNKEIRSDASETCDGKDNDCDELIDEADPSVVDAETFYRDVDKDGYGDERVPKIACSQPEGYAPLAGDCNDADDAVYPKATERCNGVDDDCDEIVPENEQDLDNDEFMACDAPGTGRDCDDADAQIHPGGQETCDGSDSDCSDNDGDLFAADEADGDGDGHRICDVNPDCNDNRADIHPGADEQCQVGEATDHNCDGLKNNLVVIRAKEDCPGVEHEECKQDSTPLFQDNWDGSSAFATIQSAINASKNEELILVQCPGTYTENLSFKGKNVILMSQHGRDNTIIDGSDLSSTVLFLNGETHDAVLDGFTIQHGNAIAGGGIAISRSSPTLRNLIVKESRATAGGGIYMVVSESSLSDIEVQDNYAIDAGGGISIQLRSIDGHGPRLARIFAHANTTDNYGAGIQASAVDLELTDVVLQENRDAILGGGLYLNFANVTASNLEVVENTVKPYPTVGLGGGIWVASSTLTLDNSQVIGNSGAVTGGGIYADSSTVVANNLRIEENHNSKPKDASAAFGGGIWAQFSALSLRNALIAHNVSAWDGGAISLHKNLIQSDGSSKQSEFINTVIVNNEAQQSGGGLSLCASDLRLSNTIVAYNRASKAGNLHDYLECDPPTFVLNHVNVYNPQNTPAFPVDESSYSGDDLFTFEPKFLYYSEQPVDGVSLPIDFHLKTSSPLRNLGTATLSSPEGVTSTLEPGVDADGSPTDLGIYGGTLGAEWDRDFDGYPDYFWPGTFADVPAGINPSLYDCKDEDASIPLEQSCPR